MNSQSIRLPGAFAAAEPSAGRALNASPTATAARVAAVDQLLRQGGATSNAPADPRQAASAAAEANRWLAEKGSELTLEFDDAAGRMIFRLVDSQTGAVVRQIPSEEVLAVARALADDAPSGALLRTDA